MQMVDMNAGRRERQAPTGVPLAFGHATFTLPAELPADVFDPLLDPAFDLAGIIRDAMTKAKDPDGNDRAMQAVIVDVLFDRPSIPVDTINAIKACLRILFGDDQWPAFLRERPSVPDFVYLVRNLGRVYGVGLGEAFGLSGSSPSVGQSSKETSGGITGSTPEASGVPQEPSTDSSESDG